MCTNRKTLIFGLLLLFSSYLPLAAESSTSNSPGSNPYQSLSTIPQDDSIQNNYYNGQIPPYGYYGGAYPGGAYPAAYGAYPGDYAARRSAAEQRMNNARPLGQHPAVRGEIEQNRDSHPVGPMGIHRGPVGRR